MNFRIIATFVIFLFGMRVNGQTVTPSEPLSKSPTIFNLPPFERTVCCISLYEGLHKKKDYPYVGYDHRLRPGERYSSDMTVIEAESLLRKNLKELCTLFRPYGKDSLLLSEISDKIRVTFSVCHHAKNTMLDKSINRYKALTCGNQMFSSFTNYDIMRAITTQDYDLQKWVQWYKEVYCF